MSALLEQLTAKLEAVRAELEAGRLIDAAALVQEAVALCASAERGGPVDPRALEAAVQLERECSAIAARVVAALTKSQKDAGTMDRAIRAYAGG